MSRYHRQILPAPSKEPESKAPPVASGQGETKDPRPVKKARLGNRRPNTRVACYACRVRKVLCDGERPACSRCRQQKKTCEYATLDEEETLRQSIDRHLAELQHSLKQHEDVVQHLRMVSDGEALAVIRRLRATKDVSAVLAAIRTAVIPQRPSDLRTARAVLPRTQTHMEFELAVLHGKVYRTLLPLDTSTVELDSLFQRHGSHLTRFSPTASLLLNAQASSNEPPPLKSGSVPPKSLILGPPSPLRGSPDPPRSPSGPMPERQYCDPQLKYLNIRYWTRIPVSNDFAASLISVYLENEHGLVGTFDSITFLDDLVALRLDFCSSFMVSSVLCLACQSYTSLDSRASSLAIAFLREAETLWHADRSSDSVTSLAAIATLSVATMCLGKEELSKELLADCRRMADKMELFGVYHTDQLVQRFRQLPFRKLRALSYAAWGCYNWLSIHASYYSEEPIKFPPALPIPGWDDSQSTPDWPVLSQPAYLGTTFSAWCQLWTIAQEIQLVYYKKGETPLQYPIPHAFAEQKYQKLLSWADNLSKEMTCEEPSSPHVLVFHAYYHIIILDTFRPFLRSDDKDSRLHSFSSLDSSPRAVFDASFYQLQRLLIDYCTNFDTRFYNFYLNGAVVHICHVILSDTTDPSWRFYLHLCMGWMKEIFVRIAVIGKVAQAFMAVAIEKGKITSIEAHSFMEELQSHGRHHKLAEVGASCVVDFDIAMSSREDGRAEELARKFNDLALFDELIEW